MTQYVSEPCPICKTVHHMTAYHQFEENGKKLRAPSDALCPCGVILRWVVPFFKSNLSGYELRPKAEIDPIRLPRDWKEVNWDNLKMDMMVLVDLKFYGKVTLLDPVGHVWVNGRHFPFTIQHTFKTHQPEE